MRYQIADLIADIPAADGLAVRCRAYLYTGDRATDIIISAEKYRADRYSPAMPGESLASMESAYQFYRALISYGGFYIHASTVVRDGKAYLFSAPSGTGKSTHTRLWIDTFGGDTRVINDDKPALRKIDGIWYAYGTPWCGKDDINLNERVPVAGLCFLEQAPYNKIHKLDQDQAMSRILAQTIFRLDNMSQLDTMLKAVTEFLSDIPVYRLENLPEPAAAILSYETMRGNSCED